MRSDDESAVSRLRVWDAPVRLFHWALVALIGAAWWTAEQRMLDWHRLAGYAIATLILFRLIWGLAGSDTARFAIFVRRPSALLAYLRGHMFDRKARAIAGHNPLGGWSVVAMLLLIATQIVLGFFAVDVDGLESGPFAWLVDFDAGRLAATWHETLFNLLLAAIGLHVAAIAFYLLYRRDNLVHPMITGSRSWSGPLPALRFGSGRLALLILFLCAGLVWLVIGLWGRA